MNAADFDTQFDRVTQQFHLPADKSREKIGLEWFDAVQHYPLPELERGVTELIRTSEESFWPPLGRLLGLLQARVDKYERGGKCATCHGSSWLESAPFLSNGMVYSNAVVRCPDCKVPPPAYNTPQHRTGLTASEYREWSQREKQPQYMPDGCEAKPKPEGDRGPMAEAMERLRLKLFGGKLGVKGDLA